MDFKRVKHIMGMADRAGAGGFQRDLALSALRFLAREYMQSMEEAGNPYDHSVAILHEAMDDEKKLISE